MYTNGLKDRFGSPLISKKDGDTNYAPITHVGDQSHLTENQKNDLDEFNTNKNDYAKQSVDNRFLETNTFEKEVKLTNGASSENSIMVNNGNVIINQGGSITFLDDGEVSISQNASGSLYVNCSSFIPIELNHNRVYDFGLIESDKDLSEMTFLGGDLLIQTCELWFKTGDVVPNFSWPGGVFWIDSITGSEPTWEANMKYRLALRWEIDTIVASISYCYKNS